jgi:hypothetical protein
VKQFVDQGFRLFQTLTDIGLMMAGAKRYLQGDPDLPSKIY